jgi:hypothetical protein
MWSSILKSLCVRAWATSFGVLDVQPTPTPRRWSVFEFRPASWSISIRIGSEPRRRLLRELALKYDIPIEWHCGFRLPVREVPDDFRGPEIPRLAQRHRGSRWDSRRRGDRYCRAFAAAATRCLARLGRPWRGAPALEAALACGRTLRPAVWRSEPPTS